MKEKTLKTYNVDWETIKILKRKDNKSQYVCRAVKALHKKQKNFSMIDIDSKLLLNVLLNRDDVSKQLKALIELELWG